MNVLAFNEIQDEMEPDIDVFCAGVMLARLGVCECDGGLVVVVDSDGIRELDKEEL